MARYKVVPVTHPKRYADFHMRWAAKRFAREMARKSGSEWLVIKDTQVIDSFDPTRGCGSA